MVDELIRARAALLEDPPRPPGDLEELARRNARRHRRRRALSGAVGTVLALVGLTLVADGGGDDARVITTPERLGGGAVAIPTATGAVIASARGGGTKVAVDLGGRPGRLAWSNDGAWLVGAIDGGLAVFRRDGSDVRHIELAGVTGYAWSPIAPIVAVQAGDGIYTVTPTGRPHRIGDLGRDLLWSPDGRKLLTQDGDLAAGGIVTMDADGSHRQVVARYADLPRASAGLQLRGWGRGGRTVLYRAHDQALGETPDPGQPLVALDLEDGTASELGVVLGRPEWVQISPDGRSVVFVVGSSFSYQDDKRLRRCDLTSGDCVDLTPGNRFALDPRWSPDGRAIAYVSASAGARLDEAVVRVVAADGREDHAVEGGALGARTPAWTADGTAIVQVLSARLGAEPPGLAVMAVDIKGGGVERLFDGPVDDGTLLHAPNRVESGATWSPGTTSSDP